MKKVSIIVPVYNKEAYLAECLESLVKQTLEDIEILVIDDGSTDQSKTIIQKFEKEYVGKIRAYYKENGGLSDTRNYGIQRANAEYIGFVDSDDYVTNDMFEKMYQKAIKSNLDVVACNVNLVENQKIEEIKSNIQEGLDLSLENKKQILQKAYPIVCNKIYKASLFQKPDIFKKGIWFEDVVFLFETVPYITSIGNMDEPMYQYRQTPNSITNTYNEKLYDFIHNFDYLVEWYQKQNLYEEYQDILEYSYVRYTYATFIKRLAKTKNKKEFSKGLQYARSKVQKQFPNYKKNVYLAEKNGKNLYLKYFNPLIAHIIYHLEKNKGN